MKLPGPDHPITIEPNPKRVRVVFQRLRCRRQHACADAAGGEPASGAITFRVADADMRLFVRSAPR